VSRVGGRAGDSFISPAVQREQVAALATARGHEVVEWIEDLDESGGKWERPGLQRALAMIESGEVDGVAVAKLDRFARSVVDGLRGIERITAAGGQFISVAESFDTTQPIGRAMLQISLVFAELERERQRDGFRVAQEHAIERGIHISTVAPVGYRRGEDRRLVLDKREAKVVHEVFSRRAQCTSWTELARFLDERLPRANGGAWPRQTIVKMIRNRTYLGEAHHGDATKRGAHPAIVSRAEFEAAQSQPGAPTRRSRSMLAGVLSCGSCGQPLSAGPRASYQCRARRSNGVCSAPVSVKAERADAEVERVFLEWAEKQDVAFAALQQTSDVAEALAELEAAEAELVAYRDGNLISILGRDVYADGLRQRAAVVDEARGRLVAAQASSVPRGHYDIASIWPRLDAAARRRVISSEIKTVVVEKTSSGKTRPVGERLRFVWRPDVIEAISG
jgi:site-specific DNA recombinase